MKDYYFLCNRDGDIPPSKQGAYMYNTFAQAQRHGKGKLSWRTGDYDYVLHIQWDGERFNSLGIEAL